MVGGLGLITRHGKIVYLNSWGEAQARVSGSPPEEEIIGIFMVQSLPHTSRLADEFTVLTYQSVIE